MSGMLRNGYVERAERSWPWHVHRSHSDLIEAVVNFIDGARGNLRQAANG
jgi:hypothetical protein